MSRTPVLRTPPVISQGAYWLWDEMTKAAGVDQHNITNSVVNRCYFAPFVPPFDITIDRILLVYKGTIAGNIIAGIYRDNGNTPVGGSLMLMSASVAKSGINRMQEITIPDTKLVAGVKYWLAAIGDEATTVYIINADFVSTGGSFQSHIVTMSGFTLDDPCPATTSPAAGLCLGVRVKSIP